MSAARHLRPASDLAESTLCRDRFTSVSGVKPDASRVLVAGYNGPVPDFLNNQDVWFLGMRASWSRLSSTGQID